MSDNQIIEILKSFQELELFSIPSYIMRSLGWLIIKGLATLLSVLETGINKVYGFMNFFNIPQIDEMIRKFQPIIIACIFLSIIFIGYQLIFNRKFDRSKLPTNLILAGAVVVMLPLFMNKFGEITQIAIGDVNSSYSSSAYTILKNNIIDIYQYDNNNFSNKDIQTKNNIPRENITGLDITEKINSNEAKNKKVFENKLKTDRNGKYGIEKLNNAWFIDFLDEGYYRWNWNFWTICITMIVTAFTLVMIGIKVGKLIFELSFNKVFAIIFAFGDIANGQRMKQVLQHIGSIFITLFTMALMLKIYLVFAGWIGDQGGIAQILVLIGVSFGVIDGPNIVERILGIDAGLNSAWKTMMSIYSASKMTGAGAKTLTDLASKIGGTGAKIAAAGIGAGAGVASAINKGGEIASSIEEEMNKESSNNSNNVKEGMNNEGSNNNNVEEKVDNQNSNNSSIEEEINSGSNSNSIEEEMDKESSNNGNIEEGISNGSNSSIEEEMGNESSNAGIKEVEGIEGLSSKASIEEQMKEDNSISSDRDSNDSLNKIQQEGLENEMNSPTESINMPSSAENDMNNSITTGDSISQKDIDRNDSSIGDLEKDIKRPELGKDNIHDNGNQVIDLNKSLNSDMNSGRSEAANYSISGKNINNNDITKDSGTANSNILNNNTKQESNVSKGGKGIEQRTISEYAKDKLFSTSVMKVGRKSFKLAENSVEKWKIKRIDKEMGDR